MSKDSDIRSFMKTPPGAPPITSKNQPQTPMETHFDSDELEMLQLLQVNKLVNPKYHLTDTKKDANTSPSMPSLSSDDLARYTLLLKIVYQSQFARDLKMCEHGYLFNQYLDRLLETMRHVIDLSPITLKEHLSHLARHYLQPSD